MRKKEDKSHSKVSSLIDLMIMQLNNMNLFFLFWTHLVGSIRALSRWTYIYAIENIGVKLSKKVKTTNVNLGLFKCVFYVSNLCFVAKALKINASLSTLRKCVG